MPTYLQYWIGTAALVLLATATPAWLLFTNLNFEAAIIGIPSILLLIWFVVATMGLPRRD